MANAKKRRRAVSRVRLHNKANTRQKFIKQHVQNPVVAEKWEPTASAAQNLGKVGVVLDPNKKEKKECKPAAPEAPLEELFGVPPPEQLDRNPRRRVMSEEDQRYIVKLLARHGDDYKAMERDIESNYWQHGEKKLQKMAAVYAGLGPDQRLVQLPQWLIG